LDSTGFDAVDLDGLRRWRRGRLRDMLDIGEFDGDRLPPLLLGVLWLLT